VGFEYGYETSTSVSEGTSIEGTVPAIPTGYYTVSKDFNWGLMSFPKSGYVLVTYWTSPR
jgi:hypothetical protein